MLPIIRNIPIHFEISATNKRNLRRDLFICFSFFSCFGLTKISLKFLSTFVGTCDTTSVIYPLFLLKVSSSEAKSKIPYNQDLQISASIQKFLRLSPISLSSYVVRSDVSLSIEYAAELLHRPNGSTNTSIIHYREKLSTERPIRDDNSRRPRIPHSGFSTIHH